MNLPTLQHSHIPLASPPCWGCSWMLSFKRLINSDLRPAVDKLRALRWLFSSSTCRHAVVTRQGLSRPAAWSSARRRYVSQFMLSGSLALGYFPSKCNTFTASSGCVEYLYRILPWTVRIHGIAILQASVPFISSFERHDDHGQPIYISMQSWSSYTSSWEHPPLNIDLPNLAFLC